MVPIGGGSTKAVLSDRWIVYAKSRKQLLHQKYLLYETSCNKLSYKYITCMRTKEEFQRQYKFAQEYHKSF